jgi:hypothetical protein
MSMVSLATAVAALVLGCLGTAATAGTSPIPDTIAFAPGTPLLDNPATPGKRGTPSILRLTLRAYDANGNILPPSPSNPIYVKVYGAAAGVISPSQQRLTSGTTATFNYTGQYFRNNLTVEAWIYDSKAGIPADEPGAVQGGYAIGVTQIVPRTRLTCNCGSETFSLNALPGDAPPNQFVIHAAVGYVNPATAARNYQGYTVDTGSLGLLTPLLELPPTQPAPTANAAVIGPGPAGVQYYTSSGKIYKGYFYLAPVTFETTDGAVQTIPTAVLAVNRHGECKEPKTESCRWDPPSKPPRLHYLGVGFDREHREQGKRLFASPAYNAFLNIKPWRGEQVITQGYILSRSAPNVTLGLTAANTRPFAANLFRLDREAKFPGEWKSIRGCFSFPRISTSAFCGHMLLDVGIDEMLLRLDPSKIPSGAAQASDGRSYVPQSVEMMVTAGSDTAPVLQYSFKMKYLGPPEHRTSVRPEYAQWVAPPPDGGISFNTGIAPLTKHDYMYNSQCGEVGFGSQQ